MASMNGRPRSDLTLTPGDPASLAGRHAVIVGGTDGIGRAFAHLMASHGARVTVVGRTFRDEGAANITFVKADLSSMKEARRVGRELAGDLVLLTTGIMAAPRREATAEGIERDLAVSFLSRLVLVQELAPRLAPGTRVLVWGFPGTEQTADLDDLNAERSYDGFRAHMATVAGNEALVLEGARRWPSLVWVGLNPGLIKTAIRANYMGAGSLKHRLSEALIGLLTPTTDAYAKRLLPIVLARELAPGAATMLGKDGRPIHASSVMGGGFSARLVETAERLVESALSSQPAG